MKIEALMIAAMLWVASVAGSYFYGRHDGAAVEVAKQAGIEQAIEETRKAANQGAADAISKIVVRNTTVQGRVETVIRDNPVYRDCQHAPDQLRNINEALTGRGAGPTGGRVMPGADAVE